MASNKFAGVGASFNRNTSGLLNDASKKLAVKQETVRFLPREKLHVSPEEGKVYPRWNEEAKLDALARDIAARGIQNPVIVYATEDGEYEILGGHRRTAANKIAVEKYGYENGELVPCIIRKAPVTGREFERTEGLILSNLQRDKSDYEHMMEIVGLRACAEKRKAAGEDIPSPRDYVVTRLGVSSTELTRYEKINESLTNGLMDMFRNEFIASTVAYELARMPEDCQEYIYESIDHDEILSLPRTAELQNLFAASKLAAAKEDGDESPAPQAPAKVEIPVPATFNEGAVMLNSAFTSLNHALNSNVNIDRRTQTKILKKIQKQMVALKKLQMELAAYGLLDDADGD